jgi:hypothetical protein
LTSFADHHRPALEALLAPGEVLEGIVAVNHQQSALRGRLLAVGVTPGRLVLQPLDRGNQPDGPPTSITTADVARAVVDHASLRLKLRTTDGTTWKLLMMHGEGVFGRLGGGEAQRQGVEAMLRWLDRRS